MHDITHVLTQAAWSTANQQLLAKCLTEFLYEELLTTTIEKTPQGFLHRLQINEQLYYTFVAHKRIMGNWHIDAHSIQRYAAGNCTTHTPVHTFITDIYQQIGISGLTLGHFLREINNTLVADCYIAKHNQLTCAQLLTLPNHELECHLVGHPWFVINKGRLGFSYTDYQKHAPEARYAVQLNWIAIHKRCAEFHSISSLDYTSLITHELHPDDLNQFNRQIIAQQRKPDDYYFLPVHQWQWNNQLIFLFAAEIANRQLIVLGSARDQYLPTQSIRTFCNLTAQTKYQVKLPLSIFNTAVYRGLPSERTRLAPQLTSWLQTKQRTDIYLQNCRLILLGEIASIDCSHATYSQLNDIPYQYKELLGVIWRDNIHTHLRHGEQAITMAALMHIDNQQTSFLTYLIARSGLDITTWLTAFFKVTIPPLLHWLYRYGLVFSPHGENTLLILDTQYRPVGLAIKDFIDDINLSQQDLPELDDLPAALRTVMLRVADHQLTQFIHTGLFVVLYRYLANILVVHAQFKESVFWQLVHNTIQTYQEQHPELEPRFRQFDLLSASFNKMCLNRIRLLSVGYADYTNRPKVDTLQAMPNPANQQVISTWSQAEHA